MNHELVQEGSYDSKEIVDGKIKTKDIQLKYILVYNTEGLGHLIGAINIFAGEGWVVKGCAGVSGGAFVILEKV